MIELVIDGKRIKTEQGKSILEVCLDENIALPNLCYDSRLKSFGACRLCLVEVERANGFLPACTTSAIEGMVVKTNTERLLEIRRELLELILSDHPDDCLVCEKNGDCKLQEYAYQYGVRREKYSEKLSILKENSPYRTNPFIERDVDKCILCGRCVRICDELMGRNVLDFANRGFSSLITTGLNKPLEESNCEFCGQCISACPVGALSSKIKKKGRHWETKKTETICPYCGCGCPIILETKGNTIINVSSNNNLCIKGRFGFDFVNHKERLKKPLISQGSGVKGQGSKFKEVEWGEALDFVAKRFLKIKEKYGADAMGGFASAKVTNEENFLFQKFMRAVLQTNNVDHCARLCHASTMAGLAKSFGSAAMTNTINDIACSDCIIVIGSNTTEAHPIVGLKIKEAIRQGAKLIVIDPRKIELVELANIWLRQKPGTDVCLINCLMNVILKEGLYKKDFINKRTSGFKDLCKAIEKYTLEYGEEITGCKKELIIEAARIYGKAERASIIYSMGITQHTTGVDNVLSLANLVMMTGNIGREGTGLNPLRGQNNVQGACDMGCLPDLLPGYQKIEDEKIRENFEKAWNVKIPTEQGLTLTEMIASIDIKCLYIIGENPLLSDPDINRVKEAFSKKEFIVVSDIFLTETAELADVVLPSCSFAEKDGTFTNTERRIQLLNKVIEPPGEAKADWEIIQMLSNKMGYNMEYKDSGEIMKEIASLTPIYEGISHKRLKNESLHWPCLDVNHPGTPILHREKFTRGLGLFCPVEYKPAAEEPDKAYPFILTTGRIREHYHTGTLSRRSLALDNYIKEGFAEINPKDASKLGILDGEMVKVSSRRGEIDIKARITDIVPSGVVFIPFHFRESPVNILTNPSLDPIAKIPEFKVSAVRI
ncbi:MAG: formate dehydrogenase subunit alpha, partial [bacterium]